MDFAIDVQLAQATRNQLRHLAAEVDDEKAVVNDLAHVPPNNAHPGAVQACGYQR
jgi:hypothetical protein